MSPLLSLCTISKVDNSSHYKYCRSVLKTEFFARLSDLYFDISPLGKLLLRRHDIQHNDTQRNDTQHNEVTQHNSIERQAPLC